MSSRTFAGTSVTSCSHRRRAWRHLAAVTASAAPAQVNWARAVTIGRSAVMKAAYPFGVSRITPVAISVRPRTARPRSSSAPTGEVLLVGLGRDAQIGVGLELRLEFRPGRLALGRDVLRRPVRVLLGAVLAQHAARH